MEILVEAWSYAHERVERQHKPQHEESAGVMYCRQPVTLRNVKTSLTIVETDYLQLCIEYQRTPTTSAEVYCRGCEVLGDG